MGLNVEHIIAKRNGEILYESHKNLENRLINLFFKQKSIFEENVLEKAYEKQNKKIGLNIN